MRQTGCPTPGDVLSPAARAAVERPTAQASGLPNAAYTSAEFARAEREALLARTWTCIGFASDLPRPGDARPVELLGLPLFAVRERGGRVRVFHNVCSHRGHQLVAAPGRIEGLLRCPYHSWTYGLDGALRGTPHIGGPGVHAVAGFDRGCHGLRAVRAGVWLDLLFVDLSGEAPPLGAHVAPIESRWRGLWGEDGPARLRAAPEETPFEIELRANWKLAVENYCESYHLPWVHPGLNQYSRLEDHYSIIEPGRFSGQGTRAYRFAERMGLALPRFPSWPAARAAEAEYVALYPNVLLGVQNDHAFAVLLEPLAPDRTRERLRLWWVGDEAAGAAHAAARRTVIEGWRQVFSEDVAAVEGMQRGRASPAFAGGVFSPVLDPPSHAFHRWVAQRLAAPELAAVDAVRHG